MLCEQNVIGPVRELAAQWKMHVACNRTAKGQCGKGRQKAATSGVEAWRKDTESIMGVEKAFGASSWS